MKNNLIFRITGNQEKIESQQESVQKITEAFKKIPLKAVTSVDNTEHNFFVTEFSSTYANIHPSAETAYKHALKEGKNLRFYEVNSKYIKFRVPIDSESVEIRLYHTPEKKEG